MVGTSMPSLVSAQAAPRRSLSLAYALGLAVGSSEAVSIATAEVARADADLARARSERRPQLSLDAGHNRLLQSPFDALARDDGPPPDPVPRDPYAPDSCLDSVRAPQTLVADQACYEALLADRLVAIVEATVDHCSVEWAAGWATRLCDHRCPSPRDSRESRHP